MTKDVEGLHPRNRARQPGYRPREGKSFSLNNSAWAAILSLCDEVIFEQDLPLTTEGWQYNDGYGFRTQHECDQLADGLERHLRNYFPEEEDPFAEDPFSEKFVIYLTRDGHEMIVAREDDPDFAEASSTWLCSQGNHCVWTKGKDVLDWIGFLRNCGGFEIY